MVRIRSTSAPARMIIELTGREPFVIEDYKMAYQFVVQACYALRAFEKEEKDARQHKS